MSSALSVDRPRPALVKFIFLAIRERNGLSNFAIKSIASLQTVARKLQSTGSYARVAETEPTLFFSHFNGQAPRNSTRLFIVGGYCSLQAIEW